jgi:hypothetical protein
MARSHHRAGLGILVVNVYGYTGELQFSALKTGRGGGGEHVIFPRYYQAENYPSIQRPPHFPSLSLPLDQQARPGLLLRVIQRG